MVETSNTELEVAGGAASPEPERPGAGTGADPGASAEARWTLSSRRSSASDFGSLARVETGAGFASGFGFSSSRMIRRCSASIASARLSAASSIGVSAGAIGCSWIGGGASAGTGLVAVVATAICGGAAAVFEALGFSADA